MNDNLIWGLTYIIYMFKLNVCKDPKNTFRVVALLYILKSVGWSKLNFQKGLQRVPTNPGHKSSNVRKSTLSMPHPSIATPSTATPSTATPHCPLQPLMLSLLPLLFDLTNFINSLLNTKFHYSQTLTLLLLCFSPLHPLPATPPYMLELTNFMIGLPYFTKQKRKNINLTQ